MYVRAVSNIDRSILSSMVYARINQGCYAKYIIYNKWKKTFELVDYMDKIVPAGESYTNEIYSATLHVDENGVFWADEYLEKPDMSFEGSIIRALSLKWKKLDDK